MAVQRRERRCNFRAPDDVGVFSMGAAERHANDLLELLSRLENSKGLVTLGAKRASSLRSLSRTEIQPRHFLLSFHQACEVVEHVEEFQDTVRACARVCGISCVASVWVQCTRVASGQGAPCTGGVSMHACMVCAWARSVRMHARVCMRNLSCSFIKGRKVKNFEAVQHGPNNGAPPSHKIVHAIPIEATFDESRSQI